MTGARLAIPWIVACVLVSAEASGDGGAVLATETSGPFVITVFTAPQPLRLGTTDVSVLVQERERGAPILDAEVTIQLSPPAASSGTGSMISAAATHAQATNKLFYAALIDLPVPGTWMLRVDVRQETGAAELRAPLSVAPRVPAVRAIWPYVVVPPVAILFFALHQWLARRRSGQR